MRHMQPNFPHKEAWEMISARRCRIWDRHGESYQNLQAARKLCSRSNVILLSYVAAVFSLPAHIVTKFDVSVNKFNNI